MCVRRRRVAPLLGMLFFVGVVLVSTRVAGLSVVR